MDGWSGLNYVFIANVIGAVIINGFYRTIGSEMESGGTIMFGAFIVLGIVIALLTLPQNRKIGKGAGWNDSKPVVAAVLMGINSALCCGIIGFIVMQTIATNHLKMYGVTGGIFGPTKQSAKQRIAELLAAPAQVPTPPQQ